VKVLVTGAGGMLARAAMSALEEGGHEVVGLTRADADITREGALAHALQLFSPDWVFHLAAFTRVDDCEADPDRAFAVNAFGSRNVALAALASGAALLTVSSDYVFDGCGSRPYREYDPANPRSVYAASKWAGEQAVRELHPRHVVVRAAWLYGRGGTNFVDTVLRRAGAGEPLRVVDDQRGSPTAAADLAPALMRLAAGGHVGTFHIANAGDCTWWELACHVVRSAGLEVAVEKTTTERLARPAPRPAYSVLSTQLYELVTGDRMPHWRDAVDRYLESRSEDA
jgi:dTDP-4-dehydrorhamnose reductase